MSAGKFIVRDDGTFGVSPTGDFPVFNGGGACADCCDVVLCSSDQDECGDCITGTETSQVDVVLSGIFECGDPCFPGNSFSGTVNPLTPINGVHRLTYTGSCTWAVQYVNAYNEIFYENVGCDGAVVSSGQTTIFISLDLSNDIWRLRAYVTIGGFDQYFFYDQQDAIIDTPGNAYCQSFPVFRNDALLVEKCLDAGPTNNAVWIGYGGTGSVTCVEAA